LLRELNRTFAYRWQVYQFEGLVTTLLKAKVSEQAAKSVLPPKEQVLPAARTEAGERALTPANNKEVVNRPAVR
jgi:hypothetical protein